MTPDPSHFSEQAALQVWRRAAELQSRAEMGVLADSAGRSESAGMSLAELEAAAAGAGIAPEFVRRAAAEVGTAPDPGALVRTLTGDAPRILRADREVPASPGELIAAIHRILPGDPYRLELAEVTGDPMAGGAITFRLEPETSAASRLSSLHEVAGRTLRLQARPIASGASELSVEAELYPSSGEPMTVAGILTGFGAAGGGLATAFTAAVATGVDGPMLLAATVPGFVAGAFASIRGFRWYYRRSVRGAAGELQALLAALEAHARTGLTGAEPDANSALR